MKINFAEPVRGLDGQPLNQNGESLILSKQLGNAIFQNADKERPLESYELAKKIYSSSGELEYTSSEIETIKKIAKENFGVIISGRVFYLISEASNKK